MAALLEEAIICEVPFMSSTVNRERDMDDNLFATQPLIALRPIDEAQVRSSRSSNYILVTGF